MKTATIKAEVRQQVLLTHEGLDHLKKELDTLTNMRRPEAVKRVAAAREQGDLSENSEYAAAKEDLAFIDGRILELEEILAQAKLISNTHSKTTVGMGASVTVRINGKTELFTIVGEWEANPKEKKISHSSPLGKALLGKKAGETVSVLAPAGTVIYKITEIK
jgi:transcription elongation factor GreA